MKKAPTSSPARWAASTALRACAVVICLFMSLQDRVVAGLDAEEDPEAAGVLHRQGGRVVEGVDATQALPGEAQPPPADLRADLDALGARSA